MKNARTATILLLALCLSACESNVQSFTHNTHASASLPKDSQQYGHYQKLMVHYDHWQGTPYAFGGQSKRGVDCSGFIQLTYQAVFGQSLPRSTKLQAKTGSANPFSELRVGDLVFFKPKLKVRHVGIYMGNGQFMHASTSRGVTLSRLDNPYWQNAYWMSRRVITP